MKGDQMGTDPANPSPRELPLSNQTRVKRRFSELASEAFCNQKDACALQQRLDDEAKPVVAQGETLVLQHPGVAALHWPATPAQSRSGWLASQVDLMFD